MPKHTKSKAACKDCLHHDVCYHIEHYGRETETEEPCEHFIESDNTVEVLHGEWIADRSPVEVEFRCSECGYSYIEADSYQSCDYKYCPMCGAKMDGDKNG